MGRFLILNYETGGIGEDVSHVVRMFCSYPHRFYLTKSKTYGDGEDDGDVFNHCYEKFILHDSCICGVCLYSGNDKKPKDPHHPHHIAIKLLIYIHFLLVRI